MKIVELNTSHIDFLYSILSERWELDDPTTKPGRALYYIYRWLSNVDNSICYIVEENNIPVGYGVFDTYNEEYKSKTPWCLSLWVHPDYRGHNYGQMLTQKRFEHARKLGYTEIYLDTMSAKDYHLKFGWEIIDEILYARHDENPKTLLYIMKHEL